MAYKINNTFGTLLVTLADGTIDTSTTDLTLIGKGYAGFGEKLNENLVKLSDYEKGTEIEAIILSIDVQRQRISLGIKQLEDDPFSAFMKSNPKGTVINGVADEIDENNVLVLPPT